MPLVVGGLSKEHVVAVSWEGAVESGPGVIGSFALILTAAVTAAYCTRAYLLLTAHVRPAPPSAPVTPAVQGVLAVLVGLSVFGGLVLLTDAFRVGGTEIVWVVITVLAIAVGVTVALRGGFDRDPARGPSPSVARSARRRWPGRRRAVPSPRRDARCSGWHGSSPSSTPRSSTPTCAEPPSSPGRPAGRAPRAFRGERPSSAVGLVLAAVVVLGLAGVFA